MNKSILSKSCDKKHSIYDCLALYFTLYRKVMHNLLGNAVAAEPRLMYFGVVILSHMNAVNQLRFSAGSFST